MTRVLYSPGFGAGLSTGWNDLDPSDPKFLELYDRGATTEEMEDLFPEHFWGGWSDVNCVEVPKGSWWAVHEYDGNEWVEIVASLEEAGYRKAT